MLNGLILCGGKSARLGIPKFTLHKNGIPLYQYWIAQLQPYCNKVYISTNNKIQYHFQHSLIIYDSESDAGPLEGIYQAFKCDPSVNWFVVAADLVYATNRDLQILLSNQSDPYEAICFINNETKEPFPLFTIYNKSIINNLHKEYLTERKSAKQLLIQSNIRLLNLKNPLAIKGINTIEDFKIWKATEDQSD